MPNLTEHLQCNSEKTSDDNAAGILAKSLTPWSVRCSAGNARVSGIIISPPAQQLVAPAQACVSQWTTREPLHGAVHAHVHHGVRAQPVLEVLVVGGILRVRGEVSLEQQTHGIALHPQRRLHPDEHVAHPEAGHEGTLAGDGGKAVVGFQLTPRRTVRSAFHRTQCRRVGVCKQS